MARTYSKSTRNAGIAALTAAGLLLVSSCSSDDQSGSSDDEIVVGTSIGLTGPAAAGCKPAGDGVGAWLDNINDDGGVNGRKFKHVVKDDATDPARTVANFKGLTQDDKVVAIVGGCGTAAAVAAVPVANQAKVPYIGPVAADKSLYDPAQPFMFALTPSYEEQLGALTRDEVAANDHTSVALVVTERPGSDDVAAAVEAAAVDGGATFLGTQTTALGATDFTATAVKLKEQAPDLLVSNLGVAEAARLLGALGEQGFAPKAIIADNVQVSQALIDAGGDAVEGRLKFTSTVPLPTADAAKPCVDALEAADVEVNLFSLQGCSQAQVFTAAVEEAGDDVTSASIVKALETLSDADVSILPPISFSSDDHLGLQAMYVFGVEGGQLADTGEVVQMGN